MDGMITGIVKFLGDNPALMTLLLGFVVGYVLGKK